MTCCWGTGCSCPAPGPDCYSWVKPSTAERPIITTGFAWMPSPEQARAAEWDERFIDLARYIAAKWSKDPSTKVGAVLVDARRRIIGTGYNGFPRGVSDTADRYQDRPTKHAMVVHAEVNAILTAAGSALGATLYCSHAPCGECAKVIIQSGVSRVVCPTGGLAGWGESQATARIMMMEAAVRFDEVEMES